VKKARDWSQMARLLTVAMATAGAPGSEVSITSLQLTANLLPTVCYPQKCSSRKPDLNLGIVHRRKLRPELQPFCHHNTLAFQIDRQTTYYDNSGTCNALATFRYKLQTYTQTNPNVAQCLNSLPANFMTKFEGIFLNWGLKLAGVVIDRFHYAIYRKRRKTELR